MSNINDEPIYIDKQKVKTESEEFYLPDRIKELLENESFAVLSTQGRNKPYASLICYASSADLKRLIFATPIKTKKYELISNCPSVSLLIDNRSRAGNSLNKISTVTLLGEANILKNKSDTFKWKTLLIDKHPFLEKFVSAPTSAIILIDVSRYFYVTRFQEVFEWNP